MPIRKDEHGKRWVEMALVVPGTPEQAWRALATGPGNTAWFTKTRIEERVGGAIRFDFGPNGSSAGEVTAWEPPSRFGYVEREWFEGAPPVATEITLAARPGDGCLVRMTHALSAAEDDWDAIWRGSSKAGRRSSKCCASISRISRGKRRHRPSSWQACRPITWKSGNA
ncbi:SRPBCC domain-containing protein [Pigmentiphaga sp. NML080357]|uniref:SRPBCC family protein n=1 Tax=Pigmentiphaga sp. NML080357 TaxID=2008675 RepID=UPI0018EA1EAA|nr:SRPBCC domain-containing protein [Pigmentiphaga sp. NML080357]